MFYFKNTELAEKYHISLGTVRNLIEAAKNGKLDLALRTEGGKSYVANTTANISIIEDLVEKRRKYRNARAVKIVTPRPEFYKLYTQEQIYDIVTNLETHREIPRQYNYFDGGAKHWDEYVSRLDNENTPNNLNTTRKLLDENQNYIDELMAQYRKVNVIDIGVGNALPVKDFLGHLLKKNKLGRYIAIDFSPDMLKVARQNLDKWFGERVVFEGHQLDITRDRFANILVADYIKNASKHTGNLMLFLGGTLQNFRNRDVPLRVINDSIGMNDFLIHTQKLDSYKARQYFDFNFEPGSISLSPNHRLVIDLLNIDEEFYDVEMGYDAANHYRYIRIRLKIVLNINFIFADGEREISFNKGETILLLRVSHDSALDIINQFDRNDFYMLQSSQTEDQEYILTISRVKRDQ